MKSSLLSTLLIFLISCFLLWLSTGHETAEAYLFPFIIGIALLLLSSFSLLRELLGHSQGAIQSTPLLRLIPALFIFVAYVLAVEYLGMYSSSLITLFLIAFIYHPAKDLIKRLSSSAMVSVGFITAMYVLFSILLKVQTPRGLFI